MIDANRNSDDPVCQNNLGLLQRSQRKTQMTSCFVKACGGKPYPAPPASAAYEAVDDTFTVVITS
jgi:hypothetical protein